MFDFHIHTTVSFDGRDDAEAMLAAAEQAGLAEICFTDHIDYTPEMDMVFDTAVYRAAYDNLRSDKLLIRRGMEYGLTPDAALLNMVGKFLPTTFNAVVAIICAQY